VTEGAGFLGSRLCERLVHEGDAVRYVYNYFTDHKDNVAHLTSNPHFEMMRTDVTLPLYVEVHEFGNLTCPASPVQ